MFNNKLRCTEAAAWPGLSIPYREKKREKRTTVIERKNKYAANPT
jgi:hypothetical protein